MKKRILGLAFTAAMAAFSGGVAANDAKEASPLTKVNFADFRLSFDEMYRLANPHLLAHRIFYDAPSTGPDATWFDAVKRGDTAKVAEMIKAGQNLEAKDEASQGQTALGWAAFIGYPDMVRLLVDSGADLMATDRGDVYHSVKSAVLGGNVEVIEYLHGKLGDKVDWDAREGDGETLALAGAVLGRTEFVKWVAQFDPDFNVVSKKDASPLSGACKEGFYDIAQLLIERGAINHLTGDSSCQPRDGAH